LLEVRRREPGANALDRGAAQLAEDVIVKTSKQGLEGGVTAPAVEGAARDAGFLDDLAHVATFGE
jgi:hypothetical protein